MQGASPDPFVLEMRELARLIALARVWLLRGPAGEPSPRVRRLVRSDAPAPASRVAAGARR